jgi:arginyl-tRNA synthetase
VLPHKQIELKLQAAVREVLPDADVSLVLVRPCPDPKFGDYQSNALMSLAKARKMNPRQLAENVVQKLDVSDLCEKVEIAGAGFLNFRLKNAALVQALAAAAQSEFLFYEKTVQPRTIVVDFSSPNVAKPMHIGHIRSTILGDSLARALKRLGHHVVRDNHIGDWGTQFGLLIYAWKKLPEQRSESALKQDPIGVFEKLYKWANSEAGTDPKVRELETAAERRHAARNLAREEARLELVKLQNGDEENLKIWREMIVLSQVQFDEIYSRLGVVFDFTFGESFYNPRLKPLVDELLEKHIARESEGAIGIFSDGSVPPKEDVFLISRDGEWVPDPALIRKSDGGFNYTTTDLATLAFRLEKWQPTEIVYVVDDRQSMHFKKLFSAFARWQPDAAKKVELVHVGFGKILGDDGKPFKTRSGETVKLADLLDEAEERAFKIVSEKNPALPEAQRKEIARVIGLGAVKYADLLPNRQSDYVFSWDKMLALTGNTAPYLQYAYARIRSIFRKSEEISPVTTRHTALALSAPEEITLAKHLLNFGLTLEAVAEEYRPNFLCTYLYELAGKFTSFYENCPVLKADNDAMRSSRLMLCDLTASVLKQGLNVLGIEVVEQM